MKKHGKGYLIPNEIKPAGRKCLTIEVPDDTIYIANVVGAITRLGQWWQWEKSGQPGDTRATQAAAFFRQEIFPTMRIDACSPAPSVGGGSMIKSAACGCVDVYSENEVCYVNIKDCDMTVYVTINDGCGCVGGGGGAHGGNGGGGTYGADGVKLAQDGTPTNALQSGGLPENLQPTRCDLMTTFVPSVLDFMSQYLTLVKQGFDEAADAATMFAMLTTAFPKVSGTAAAVGAFFDSVEDLYLDAVIDALADPRLIRRAQVTWGRVMPASGGIPTKAGMAWWAARLPFTISGFLDAALVSDPLRHFVVLVDADYFQQLALASRGTGNPVLCASLEAAAAESFGFFDNPPDYAGAACKRPFNFVPSQDEWAAVVDPTHGETAFYVSGTGWRGVNKVGAQYWLFIERECEYGTVGEVSWGYVFNGGAVSDSIVIEYYDSDNVLLHTTTVNNPFDETAAGPPVTGIAKIRFKSFVDGASQGSGWNYITSLTIS